MTAQSKAKSKAKAYADMNKAEMNAAYDAIRNDPNASVEGMKMHNAFFNKNPQVNNETIPSTDSSVGKVTVPPSLEAKPIEFDSSTALYIGDSIATGLGHGGAKGNENSDARWGRGAAETLALLNSRPENTFKDKDIVLSSGVLNSGADWDTVRSQINLLNSRGARSIRLVGTPNTDKYSSWNDTLSGIAKETGATFLGGYEPGNDGIHPLDYSTHSVYRQI